MTGKETVEHRNPLRRPHFTAGYFDRAFKRAKTIGSLIDGEFAGSTRLDTKLPLGLHLVRVEKDGFNAFEESVNPLKIAADVAGRTGKGQRKNSNSGRSRCLYPDVSGI